MTADKARSWPEKVNCWEFNRCGREPGGCNARAFGACPAALEPRVDGVNGGKNGGRTCWGVAGTLCTQPASTFAAAVGDCTQCDFYRQVVAEEGAPCIRSAFIIHTLVRHGH
jgi:hypothetical protein